MRLYGALGESLHCDVLKCSIFVENNVLQRGWFMRCLETHTTCCDWRMVCILPSRTK